MKLIKRREVYIKIKIKIF